MEKRELKPMGAVFFLGKVEPVVWERETDRYVFNIKRLEKQGQIWKERYKYYEEKMDKEEILEF